MHPSIPTSHTTNIFNKNISKRFLTWLRGAGDAPVRDEVGDPLDVPDGETVAGPGVVAEGEAGEGGQGGERPHRVVPQQVVVQAQHLRHHLCYHQKNIFTKLNNCWPGTVKVSNRLLLRWEMRESEGLRRKYLGYCICQIFTQCYISLSLSPLLVLCFPRSIFTLIQSPARPSWCWFLQLFLSTIRQYCSEGWKYLIR